MKNIKIKYEKKRMGGIQLLRHGIIKSPKDYTRKEKHKGKEMGL